VRVVSTCDSKLLGSLVSRILSQESDFCYLGELSALPDCQPLYETNQRDLVAVVGITDQEWGVRVVSTLRRQSSALKIVVASLCLEERFAVLCLKAGACAFVARQEGIQELVDAIRAVYRKGRYVTPAVADLLAEHLCSRFDQNMPAELSGRELQVLRSLAVGVSTKDIAYSLEVSVKTVSTYRSRVLRKLNLHSNAELVRYALATGLIGLQPVGSPVAKASPVEVAYKTGQAGA